MNILLDSHVLLWALHAPERLETNALALIRNRRHAVFFSAASVWELELKAAKGKLTLPDSWLEAADVAGFTEITIAASDARTSAALPWHHSNPFDRLLVAQAITRGLRLATRDPLLRRYEVETLEA